MRQWIRSAAVVAALASAPCAGPVHALTIELDYRYDTAGFFADPARRDLMNLAASYFAGFVDALAPIAPAGGEAWTVYFNNPGDLGSGLVAQTNLRVEANTISVFAGGSAMGAGVLGFGTTGFVTDLTGSDAFVDAVMTRAQENALGPEATDYGVWGGAVSFNSDAPWHFGATVEGLDAGEHDFLTTAIHELGHLLGFGVADSWLRLLDAGFFTGAAAMSAYGGPVPADAAHWGEGVMSFVDGRAQETLMDPTTAAGMRELPTLLDYAGWYDIGWQPASVPLPATVWALGSALATTVLLRRRRRGLRGHAFFRGSGFQPRLAPA